MHVNIEESCQGMLSLPSIFRQAESEYGIPISVKLRKSEQFVNKTLPPFVLGSNQECGHSHLPPEVMNLILLSLFSDPSRICASFPFSLQRSAFFHC